MPTETPQPNPRTRITVGLPWTPVNHGKYYPLGDSLDETPPSPQKASKLIIYRRRSNITSNDLYQTHVCPGCRQMSSGQAGKRGRRGRTGGPSGINQARGSGSAPPYAKSQRRPPIHNTAHLTTQQVRIQHVTLKTNPLQNHSSTERKKISIVLRIALSNAETNEDQSKRRPVGQPTTTHTLTPTYIRLPS